MNKNYKDSLKDIQEMSSRLRGFTLKSTLNEGILFNEEFDDEMPEDDIPQDEPDLDIQTGEEDMMPQQGMEQQEPQMQQQEPMDVEKAKPEDEGMKELDEMGAIDKIREIALEGMKQLAKQPEHPQYQALRKVLQLVDKAVDDELKNQQAQ